MTPSTETISRLLGRLYEAAAAPQLWQSFLIDLSETANADKAYFHMFDAQHRCDLSIQHGFADSAIADYTEYYVGRDLILDRFVQAKQQHGDWIGGSESVISKQDLRNSEVFNDFIQPNGAAYHCAAALDDPLFGVAGLSMMRGEAAGPFSEEIIALLAILSPHVKSAVRIHQALSQVRTENALLQRSVDAVTLAMIAVDHEGRILNSTAAATQILNARDGLEISGQYLRAAVHAEQSKLSALLTGAVATGSGHGNFQAARPSGATAPQVRFSALWTPPSGGAMLISRRAPKRSLQLMVTPFHSSEVFAEESPAALIFLSDPDATPASRASVLRALYGLSPTECRLTDLIAAGHEVATAADHLRLKAETVRFHLKSIFRKTATHRQSDLVRLVIGIPAGN
jgi:DNA-binding CsgD family transcriptional regulator